MQLTQIDPEAALNETQAAEFLGVSVRTLQAWRVRGGGPRFCKMNRAVRYQRKFLTKFQEACTVGSTSQATVRLLAAKGDNNLHPTQDPVGCP